MALEQLENKDPTQNLNAELSLNPEIDLLRQNPALNCVDLFSARKMNSSEYPEGPDTRVVLGAPIETAVSDRSDVEQDLMAVISLGNEVALGVVKGRDKTGNEINYVSLLNNDPEDNEGRARILGQLTDGGSFAIGRQKIEQTVGRNGCAPGVSKNHCTIELKNGILSVVDESSLNGTSVFTNSSKETTWALPRVQSWSQPSSETKKLIDLKVSGSRGDAIAPSPETPSNLKTEVEDAHEVETRYTDAEILGKSFRVRRSVQEAGTKSIKTWQGLKAKLHNAVETPGKAIKQFAYNRAKKSLDRREDRLRNASNARLQQRRQHSVNQARERLKFKEDSLNQHVDRMDQRLISVKENAEKRRQDYIDVLKIKRANALARKAVREQLRQDGASRLEARSILTEIPPSHMDRIGKLAILAETSRRLSLNQSNESSLQQAEAQHKQNLDQLLNNVLNETDQGE